MTLIEHIERICERATHQLSREESRAESQRLAPLLKDAGQFSASLAAEIERLRFFRDQGFSVTVPDKAAAARKTLSRLRERFSRDYRAEQLTRGREWALLSGQIRETREELDSNLRTEWRCFVDSAYSGDNPDNVESVLAATEGNRKNLVDYRRAHTELRQYARTRPESREDFARVRALARILTEIYDRFDFSVPDDVKRFLQAVASGGAGLELLTQTVLDWLHEQNTAGQYRVVSRTGQ